MYKKLEGRERERKKGERKGILNMLKKKIERKEVNFMLNVLRMRERERKQVSVYVCVKERERDI